jgi:hypothetical protein
MVRKTTTTREDQLGRGRKIAYRAEKRRKEMKRLAKQEAKKKKQQAKGGAAETEETRETPGPEGQEQEIASSD